MMSSKYTTTNSFKYSFNVSLMNLAYSAGAFLSPRQATTHSYSPYSVMNAVCFSLPSYDGTHLLGPISWKTSLLGFVLCWCPVGVPYFRQWWWLHWQVSCPYTIFLFHPPLEQTRLLPLSLILILLSFLVLVIRPVAVSFLMILLLCIVFASSLANSFLSEFSHPSGSVWPSWTVHVPVIANVLGKRRLWTSTVPLEGSLLLPATISRSPMSPRWVLLFLSIFLIVAFPSGTLIVSVFKLSWICSQWTSGSLTLSGSDGSSLIVAIPSDQFIVGLYLTNNIGSCPVYFNTCNFWVCFCPCVLKVKFVSYRYSWTYCGFHSSVTDVSCFDSSLMTPFRIDVIDVCSTIDYRCLCVRWLISSLQPAGAIPSSFPILRMIGSDTANFSGSVLILKLRPWILSCLLCCSQFSCTHASSETSDEW